MGPYGTAEMHKEVSSPDEIVGSSSDEIVGIFDRIIIIMGESRL